MGQVSPGLMSIIFTCFLYRFWKKGELVKEVGVSYRPELGDNSYLVPRPSVTMAFYDLVVVSDKLYEVIVGILAKASAFFVLVSPP